MTWDPFFYLFVACMLNQQGNNRNTLQKICTIFPLFSFPSQQSLSLSHHSEIRILVLYAANYCAWKFDWSLVIIVFSFWEFNDLPIYFLFLEFWFCYVEKHPKRLKNNIKQAPKSKEYGRSFYTKTKLFWNHINK